MASVGKCLGIMASAGMLAGAGYTYAIQSKINKFAGDQITAHAKDGKVSLGKIGPDGKQVNTDVSVDEFKKNMKKSSIISSLITGTVAALGTTLIAGLTLLLRGKIKR